MENKETRIYSGNYEIRLDEGSNETKVVEASETDGRDLIGSGHGIAVAEDIKKPENKAVKKKSIFSRKKK